MSSPSEKSNFLLMNLPYAQSKNTFFQNGSDSKSRNCKNISCLTSFFAPLLCFSFPVIVVENQSIAFLFPDIFFLSFILFVSFLLISVSHLHEKILIEVFLQFHENTFEQLLYHLLNLPDS